MSSTQTKMDELTFEIASAIGSQLMIQQIEDKPQYKGWMSEEHLRNLGYILRNETEILESETREHIGDMIDGVVVIKPEFLFMCYSDDETDSETDEDSDETDSETDDSVS